MRNTWKSILGAALLVMGATQSRAQNTVLNVVQELNFKLTGYYQMSPTENSSTFFRHAGKVSINNKDIINLIEKEVNIIFSNDAKLMLISTTPVDTTPKVIIRDKFEGEKVDTDVTQYFSAEVLAGIEETKINKNPLKASGTSYDVVAFELNLTQVHFRISGFGLTQVKTGKFEGEPAAIVHTGKVDASGSGAYQVNFLTGVVPVALIGTVSISGSEVKALPE
jgi:hypothetical protein